ncbi:ABC transporter ATP-binding protein [Treponema parvum]|uniref:ABC transporter ATP-binding protein n=1 Tax=Treponema parvum TaxID=138851 RepID=UPI001AEBD5DD|nr:ABC transporter ATP-binding protein [Treponema parvum]QTQ16126.1 ABC transporter ATP-binding protein [Treponema parvum]
MSFDKVLDIKDFSLSFMMRGRKAYAVKNISLEVFKGEITALVGESGCGKTMTALSCMGLQPEDAMISGRIELSGRDVLSFSRKQWNSFRGKNVSMIFQEPMTSLDPLVKVGKQIAEAGIVHGFDKASAKKKALQLMEEVNLSGAKNMYDDYPFMLSGGQRQRIMIASALMNEPELLIADEPTSALDATTQLQIMKALCKINEEFKTSILFISHDIALVKKFCTRVYIMYAGSILECGGTKDVLENPVHPYTKALLKALPSAEKRNTELTQIQGFVPPIDFRPEDQSYLYERWPSAKDVCYRRNSNAAGAGMGVHKAYCHLHNVLEDV